jgi:predicted nucleic acid-binding Zn ribbon protein
MNGNFCICCGAEIPEGRQVCWGCEHSVEEKENEYETKEKDDGN